MTPTGATAAAPPPQRWLVLEVHAADPLLHDDVAEALLELGGSAVQVQGDTLTSYFQPPPDDAHAQAFARDALQELRERLVGAQSFGRAPVAAPEPPAGHAPAATPAPAAAPELRLDWRWEAHQDWAREWRRGLRPRHVGPFLVTPSWCRPELDLPDPAAQDPPSHVIVVDPEMAFGTGEHATTRGALRLLAEAVRPGDRVLDVGTGSAILAIGAAMLGAERVLAVESDGDAIENAADNLRRNGVADRVQLVHALVDPPFLQASGPFDVIVANVLSGILRPLLTSFHHALHPGGRLILGGILEEEADELLDATATARLTLLVEDLEAEWWGALFRRPD